MSKRWTCMVWMAGDNDLESFGKGDLKELKTVGSTADVDVVVQLDTMHDDRTRRYYVRKGTTPERDVVKDLGATDTGDPKVATEFFTWAMQTYPAQHYLAVIWNHGSGIDETDVYRTAAGRGLTVERGARPSATTVPRSRVRAVTSSRFRRSLFSTTIAAAAADRGIAYDDSARDFLDNAELKRVLTNVRKATGRSLDVLGFDACLMNMIEIAVQLQGTTRYLVASQEVEPGDGWPYDAILAALARKPSTTPEALGKLVVREYVKSYSSESVTQALLSLTALGPVTKAVDALAAALLAAMKKPADYAAIMKAVNRSQRYDTRDFLDLCDFCEQLATRLTSAPARQRAKAVVDALASSGLVVAEGHKGSSVARSHGVSIYFPRGDVSVAYDRLDFAKTTRWGTFVDRVMKA